MAYVMNPYSYKLGYSLSWSDNWYSNKKLYPVMLQIMLTVRYFLLFFWTNKTMEKLDVYLSHLNLTLKSGRLLLTLFFYEARMNQAEKYRYKMLTHIIHSIPYSDRNPEFIVNWHVRTQSIHGRAQDTPLAAKWYFFCENTIIESFESQRFFLFFYFLGLDPATFLLEFYLRYGDRHMGDGLKRRIMKDVMLTKRYKGKGKGTKYPHRLWIHQFEYVFLNRIYKFLNDNVFFFWLYDKEKNLSMVRFLRTLFFYGGMAHFGTFYAPLMRSPELVVSRFKSLSDRWNSKKLTKTVNIVKKKKKTYNSFLQKLQIICYFSLLNLNYDTVINQFKKNYKKYNIYNFLKETLLNIDNLNHKDQKKYFLTYKKSMKHKINFNFWKKLKKQRSTKLKEVKEFRAKKSHYIEKYYSSFMAKLYSYSQMGSTKFDSWSGFYLSNKLKSYNFIINKYGFSTNFQGRKLKINSLTTFNYYRFFFNVFGNFSWSITGKFLNYAVKFSKNISRYVFLNDYYKNLFKNFFIEKIKTLKKNFNLDTYLHEIYLNYHDFEEFTKLKNLYYIAFNKFAILRRSQYWYLFTNFWDFRKLYPKYLDRINHAIKFYSNIDINLHNWYVKLLNEFTKFEAAAWKIYDKYRKFFCEFLKLQILVRTYIKYLKKSFRYKKNYFNYKKGLVKKFNLYATKNKKNILYWKTKYWYKYKNFKDANQLKGEFIMFKRNTTQRNNNVRTFLFLQNAGIFRSVEQNQIHLMNWFDKENSNKTSIFIQKNNLDDIRKDFFYKKKKYTLNKMKRTYCYVNDVTNDLKIVFNFVKKLTNKKYLNKNKYNFYSFLKSNNYKVTTFLKTNYKGLINHKKLKKSNLMLLRKKLLVLNNNIKALKKLSFKKRLKHILKFFKMWHSDVKKERKKNNSFVDNEEWYKFVYKLRTNKFKWKHFKIFLRKKEEINWRKLFIFLKYGTLNSSFDMKSVKKKIKTQQYKLKKENFLLDVFFRLYRTRRKRIKKQKRYPQYGIDLYKYFTNYKYLAPLFKKKTMFKFRRTNRELRFVRFSYARLFFIFWFLSLRSNHKIEPKEMFLNKEYNRTNVYHFGTLLFVYLLKKPFFDYFSYYIIATLKFWLNISVDFNYVIITNEELSAQFIANHVARALHFGYKWREVVKPIRVDLKTLLTNVRVLENRSRNSYFTKYENFNKYEKTMYEYSFIYIKLHIKNYLLSFKYYLQFKNFNNYIKHWIFRWEFLSKLRRIVDWPKKDKEDQKNKNKKKNIVNPYYKKPQKKKAKKFSMKNFDFNEFYKKERAFLEMVHGRPFDLNKIHAKDRLGYKFSRKKYKGKNYNNNYNKNNYNDNFKSRNFNKDWKKTYCIKNTNSSNNKNNDVFLKEIFKMIHKNSSVNEVFDDLEKSEYTIKDLKKLLHIKRIFKNTKRKSNITKSYACLWSFTLFFNFFFKLKYIYFFISLNLKKNFIYIRLNFLNWLNFWKKKIISYKGYNFNLKNDFIHKNLNITFNLQFFFNKNLISLFYFTFLKNKLYQITNNSFFNLTKNIDIKINNIFKNKIINITLIFCQIKKILNIDLFKNNKFLLKMQNFIKYFKRVVINYFLDLKYLIYFILSLIKINLNKNFVINNNILNIINIINSFKEKIIIILKYKNLKSIYNFILKKKIFINFLNFNLGYNNILYKSVEGYIYLYFNSLIKYFKDKLLSFKNNLYLNLLNKLFNYYIYITKIINKYLKYINYFHLNVILEKINLYQIELKLIITDEENIEDKENIIDSENKEISEDKKNIAKKESVIVKKSYIFKNEIFKNNYSSLKKNIKIYINLNKYSNVFIFLESKFKYKNINILNIKFLIIEQFKYMHKKYYLLNNISKINHKVTVPSLQIATILSLKKFDWNLLKVIGRSETFNKDYLSKYSSIVKKNTFIEYFYHNRFLIGYKFRFAGRFKRRRKRTIMWLKKGLIPITAHDKWIDYGYHEISNEHSQYSVRIWLNKNKNVKYKHYFKF